VITWKNYTYQFNRKTKGIKKMTKNNIKHYRGIKVKFLTTTNCLEPRIELIDERFNQSKTINYNYIGELVFVQAIDYLIKHGFNVVGYFEMKNEYIVFCDNWINGLN